MLLLSALKITTNPKHLFKNIPNDWLNFSGKYKLRNITRLKQSVSSSFKHCVCNVNVYGRASALREFTHRAPSQYN